MILCGTLGMLSAGGVPGGVGGVGGVGGAVAMLSNVAFLTQAGSEQTTDETWPSVIMLE